MKLQKTQNNYTNLKRLVICSDALLANATGTVLHSSLAGLPFSEHQLSMPNKS
jgi:hypothetical protein